MEKMPTISAKLVKSPGKIRLALLHKERTSDLYQQWHWLRNLAEQMAAEGLPEQSAAVKAIATEVLKCNQLMQDIEV
jgi:hypothetical protein